MPIVWMLLPPLPYVLRVRGIRNCTLYYGPPNARPIIAGQKGRQDISLGIANALFTPGISHDYHEVSQPRPKNYRNWPERDTITIRIT